MDMPQIITLIIIFIVFLAISFGLKRANENLFDNDDHLCESWTDADGICMLCEKKAPQE